MRQTTHAAQTATAPRGIALIAPPQPQQIHAPAQGLRFESVERDGVQWAVEFEAGDRPYRYLTGEDFSRLQIRDFGQRWATVASGPATEEAVLSVIEYMAGLTIDWPTFRMGYEQFYCGFVAGWCSGDEAAKQGIDF